MRWDSLWLFAPAIVLALNISGASSKTYANEFAPVSRVDAQSGQEIPDEISELKKRIIETQNKGKLGFRKIVACRSVEEFGVYSPLESSEPVPKLILYCEPFNVSTLISEDRYIIDFTVDVFLMDREGKIVSGKENVIRISRVSRSPVIDLYFKIGISSQKPGAQPLTAKIVLHDKIKNDSVSTSYNIFGKDEKGKQDKI
jgi:hypothetical protein